MGEAISTKIAKAAVTPPYLATSKNTMTFALANIYDVTSNPPRSFRGLSARLPAPSPGSTSIPLYENVVVHIGFNKNKSFVDTMLYERPAGVLTPSDFKGVIDYTEHLKILREAINLPGENVTRDLVVGVLIVFLVNSVFGALQGDSVQVAPVALHNDKFVGSSLLIGMADRLEMLHKPFPVFRVEARLDKSYEELLFMEYIRSVELENVYANLAEYVAAFKLKLSKIVARRLSEEERAALAESPEALAELAEKGVAVASKAVARNEEISREIERVEQRSREKERQADEDTVKKALKKVLGELDEEMLGEKLA